MSHTSDDLKQFKAEIHRNAGIESLQRRNYPLASQQFKIAAAEFAQESDLLWLGVSSLCIGDHKSAVDSFGEVLEQNPNSRAALHHLALIYSSCPSQNFRNGTLALSLARRTHALSPKYWRALSVLAAAHAEQGEFHNALIFAKLTLVLAPEEIKNRFRLRICQYQARIPYRFSIDDIRSSFEFRDIKCNKCGQPSIGLIDSNPYSGLCLTCWRSSASSQK